jgi:hypothetical protein
MTEHASQPSTATMPTPAPATAPTTGLSPHAMALHRPAAPAPGVGLGPVGTVRSTGTCIALTVVTLGFYSLYWYYSVHEELKRHTGRGLGGGVALLLAFLVGFVMPYFTSSEVGQLSTARGQEAPVSGVTGLWFIPGFLLLVGPLVWFIKTNGALNAYWRSCA